MTMAQSKSGDLLTAEIKALASRFSAEQIDRCIALTLQQSANPCFVDADAEKVMNVLAKAEFVKTRMERGISQQEAIRELGRRIRKAQAASR